MTDDLVKRLRNPIGAMRPTLTDGREAADRIEELEAKLAKANDHIEGLEELLWAAEKDASEAEAYAAELEAKLTGGKDD